jgi:predicted MFS family arabinose efflux permease
MSYRPPRALAPLWTAAFASSAAMRLCDPMLPRLASEFGVEVAAVASIVTVYAIGYGGMQLVHGPLGERVGKIRLITAAALLAALVALASAAVTSLDGLIVARLVAGGIGAAIIPLGFAWLGDVVPLAHRQPVLARFASGSLLGTIGGQLIGGGMVDTLGWRAAFVALAACFLASGLLLAREARRLGRDAGAHPATEPDGVGAPVSSHGSIGARYLGILRGRWVRTLLVIVAFEGVLVFGPMAFVPSTLHERLGVPLWQAGATAAMFAAGGAIYTVFARALLARLGERGLVTGGALLAAAGLLVVNFTPVWPPAVIACLAIGFGFFGLHNTMQVHGTQLSPGQSGLGMALFALALFLGQSLGVALASALIARAGYGVVYALSAPLLVVLGFTLRHQLGRQAAGRAPG